MGWFRIYKTEKTPGGNVGAVVQTSYSHITAFPYVGIFPHGFATKAAVGSHGFAISTNGENGENVMLGYVEKDEGLLSDGDTVIFAQSEKGVKSAKVNLRADGSVDIDGKNGARISITSEGDIEISGRNVMIKDADKVKIEGGNVEISGDSDVKIQGWDFLSHTHNADGLNTTATLGATPTLGEIVGLTGGVSSIPTIPATPI